MHHLKKESGFSAIEVVLVAVLIAAVGVAGYLGFENYAKSAANSQPYTTSSSSPTPALTAASTYKAAAAMQSLGFNFSLQYPSSWKINDTGPSGSSGGPLVIFTPAEVANVSVRTLPCISVSASIENTAQTLQGYIAEQDGIRVTDLTTGNQSSPISTVKSSKDLTISGLSGVERQVVRTGETATTTQTFLKGSANKSPSGPGTNFYELDSCPNTDQNTIDAVIASFKAS
jgi:Tfp pilus assembly protein PilV